MTASTTITVSPPTVRVRVIVPPLYSIRMTLASWIISLAGWVAQGVMVVEVLEDDFIEEQDLFT